MRVRTRLLIALAIVVVAALWGAGFVSYVTHGGRITNVAFIEADADSVGCFRLDADTLLVQTTVYAVDRSFEFPVTGAELIEPAGLAISRLGLLETTIPPFGPESVLTVAGIESMTQPVEPFVDLPAPRSMGSQLLLVIDIQESESSFEGLTILSIPGEPEYGNDIPIRLQATEQSCTVRFG